MSRATLEVADIIHTAGDSFWQQHGPHLAWSHRKALDAIAPQADKLAEYQQRLEDRIERYRQRWDSEIGGHMADPPRFDDVLRAVRRQLRAAGLLDE